MQNIIFQVYIVYRSFFSANIEYRLYRYQISSITWFHYQILLCSLNCSRFIFELTHTFLFFADLGCFCGRVVPLCCFRFFSAGGEKLWYLFWPLLPLYWHFFFARGGGTLWLFYSPLFLLVYSAGGRIWWSPFLDPSFLIYWLFIAGVGGVCMFWHPLLFSQHIFIWHKGMVWLSTNLIFFSVSELDYISTKCYTKQCDFRSFHYYSNGVRHYRWVRTAAACDSPLPSSGIIDQYIALHFTIKGCI